MSWLIRWALPRSRFALALSSHCLIVRDDKMYTADWSTGVQLVNKDVAMKRRTIVKSVEYDVPNLTAGFIWLDDQVGKPYDKFGALGVSLNPDRDWEDCDSWFCYELLAGALKAAGRDEFAALNHITEIALMALKA